MAIVRWNPWREITALERQFDELFGRRSVSKLTDARAWAPAIDVHHDGDTIVVRADFGGGQAGRR